MQTIKDIEGPECTYREENEYCVHPCYETARLGRKMASGENNVAILPSHTLVDEPERARPWLRQTGCWWK
ncbi:hypothetical protein BD413DRAFT_532598 [Trametes elegans]|nr:hypothetical protein BD413DRAFT_532598 [Trametes elegans]